MVATNSKQPNANSAISRSSKIIKKLKEKNRLKLIDSSQDKKAYDKELSEGCCVEVSNLPYGFVTKNFRAYCKQYGRIIEATVPTNPRNGATKGKGYVLFADPDVAKIFAYACTNYLVCGNLLKAKTLKPPEASMQLFKAPDEEFHIRNNKDLVEFNSHGERTKCSILLDANYDIAKLCSFLPGALSMEDLGFGEKQLRGAQKLMNSRKALEIPMTSWRVAHWKKKAQQKQQRVRQQLAKKKAGTKGSKTMRRGGNGRRGRNGGRPTVRTNKEESSKNSGTDE